MTHSESVRTPADPVQVERHPAAIPDGKVVRVTAGGPLVKPTATGTEGPRPPLARLILPFAAIAAARSGAALVLGR
ncbi:hypothetical protein [Streptomyces sp. YU58]|uniref:hypothetical protein n=1 Tax=Streptomyces sp. SX92 TaxID=3158972 RepID=UPI0027B9803B|nr:hypothetical protein [Streptomyces coralus]WLW57715.1 hypothetical protein QU709_42920 [Streptomyces coralus]